MNDSTVNSVLELDERIRAYICRTTSLTWQPSSTPISSPQCVHRLARMNSGEL